MLLTYIQHVLAEIISLFCKTKGCLILIEKVLKNQYVEIIQIRRSYCSINSSPQIGSFSSYDHPLVNVCSYRKSILLRCAGSLLRVTLYLSTFRLFWEILKKATTNSITPKKQQIRNEWLEEGCMRKIQFPQRKDTKKIF